MSRFVRYTFSFLFLAVLPLVSSCRTGSPSLTGSVTGYSAAIKGLRVHRVRTKEGAYRPPYGASADPLGGWGNTSVHLSGVDNGMVTAVASLGRGIAGGQQRDFEARNQARFPVLRSAMISATPGIVQTAVRSALRESVLGPLMDKSQPDADLYIDVEGFGLVRTGLSPSGEVLLAPQLRFKIQTTSGQILVNGRWVRMDKSNVTPDPSRARVNKSAFWTYTVLDETGSAGHPLSAYTANPALLRSELQKTARAALRNLPAAAAKHFGS